MTLWLLRVSWFVLPLLGGRAALDALDRLGRAPRMVGGALLWVIYGVVLLATFAPRPIGLTALRTAAALALILALIATPHTSAVRATFAIIATTAAAILASMSSLGREFVNGAAYGDEKRFPLRIPPALWIGPAPLAVLAVGAGLAAGPLLLADRRWVAGALATVIGVPLAAAAFRSLHSLARRWIILVPAGIVVHDPLTLADPVLFPRDRIASLAVASTILFPTGDETLDVRLGAAGGSIALELNDDAPILRARPGRKGGVMVTVCRLLICPSQPGYLLELAAQRRIHIRR